MAHKSKKRDSKRIIGRLDIAFEGYGFLIPEEKGKPDVFIPAHAIFDALHGDRIEAKVVIGRKGKLEGRIERIVERSIKQVVGRYEIRGKSAIVISDQFRVRKNITIPKDKSNGAKHNEIVVVAITKYQIGDNPMEGEVIKILGQRGSNETELNILIARHEVDYEFSKQVLDFTEKIKNDFYKTDFKNRTDLRELPFITVDGEDAKDFDDAVYAREIGNGMIKLIVSIADVSHFVRENSILDKEAFDRSTSVYLPGRCIPMLPPALSTDICSLLPLEDRFCFSAEMNVDGNGKITKSKFYKSVIKSKYRMTYTEANKVLSENDKLDLDTEILDSLYALNNVAALLRKNRVNRGSIDFDLPESSIELDLQGKPENIIKAERNSAHMLIEDLMIAANEAVAEFLTNRHYPCVYRVHDKPNNDHLVELQVLMQKFGHSVKISQNPKPKMLAKVVNAVDDRPEKKLINMLLLRAMSRAIYSTDNIGHFGLASQCYCHFTSPIRRYPDLLIHRLLADALQFEHSRLITNKKYLKDCAEKASKMERRAVEAEREAIKLYCAMFMQDHIGEEFDGLICHTAKKGIFVELIDYFIEGMIEPFDLVEDKFIFDPKHFAYVGKKTKKIIQIGDKVRVKVKDVSIEDRRIFFEKIE